MPKSVTGCESSCDGPLLSCIGDPNATTCTHFSFEKGLKSSDTTTRKAFGTLLALYHVEHENNGPGKHFVV